MVGDNCESVKLNQMYLFENEVNDKYGKDERINSCFIDFYNLCF